MHKKKTFKSVVIVLLAVAFISMACQSFAPEGKYKDFVRQLAEAVQKNDRDAILQMYPDAALADSLVVNYVPDSLKIEINEQDGTAVVRLSKDVCMTLTGGDTLQVVSSQGLFASSSKRMHFAKATGWFDASLTDKENVQRMANTDFPEYLLKTFNESLKEGLQIVNSGTWGDDYYEGEWVSSKGATFTVHNSTSFDVPGSAYSILYKEGYWGGGKMATEVVKGEDVKAGQSVNLRTKELGSSMESENSQTLTVKGLEMQDFMAQYKPTGREYAEYVASHGQVKKGRESLHFTVEGLMGGCGTRLSLMGDEGSLLYNPKGSEIPIGGEQREVKLISYDPATMRLVLQVSKYREQKTGVLDGTLKDGVYSGQFKNVNGKSSPFSFK